MNRRHPDPLKSLDFRRLVGARVSNEFSQSMMGLSITVLLVAWTGEATLAGVCLGVYTACLILCQVVSGTIVDRVRADRALRWSAATQAVGWGVVLIGALGHENRAFCMGMIILGAIIGGTASGLDGPAEFSLTRQLVPKEDFQKASAVAQGRESVATTSGDPIAGVLSSITTTLPLIIQIVFSTLAALLVPTPTRRTPPESPSESPGGAFASFVEDVKEGYRFVFRDSGLRALALIAGISNFAMALLPMTLLMHFTAAGEAPWKLGILSAMMGLVMIAGAWFAGKFADRFSFFFAGILALGGELIGALLFMGTLHSLVLTCLVFVVECFFLPLFNSGFGAYMAFACTDENEGRVSAATGALGMVLMPLGSIASGLLLDRFGALPGLWICAIIFAVCLCLMVGSTSFRRMPRYAEMAAQEKEEQEEGAPDAV